MINLITGKPGSGKTYILAKKCYQWLKEGNDVWCNFKLAWNEKNLHYFRDLADLTEVKRGIIAMDEAHIYFNSRQWENLSVEIQYKLQQHRKDGLDIWGTVQHESRIDVVFRELVSQFFVAHQIYYVSYRKFLTGLFRLNAYWPEDMKNDNKRSVGGEWHILERKFCDFYDTLAKIPAPENVREFTHLVKYCKTCGYEKVIHS